MKITDQIGHNITLLETPKRIISLVPSQTELLNDLGLDERVVGITKFCIHPKHWFKNKNRVGGTKTVDFKKIAALKPDLIIANKEENTKSEIEYLQKRYNVYTSDISNLEDSLLMMLDIGRITKTLAKSRQLTNQITCSFNKLKANTNSNTVIYFIWQNPFIAVGSNTFINDMLTRCGYLNTLTDKLRYPELNEELIKEINPDLIFLSSEPYPFKQKHINIFQKLCPTSKVLLVDGEMFSWYGSRLLKSVNYFIDLKSKIS